MECYTEKAAEARYEIGKREVPTRYFKSAWVGDDADFIECTEAEFLEANGTIEYERHTVHANGVAQICLTKNNWG